MRKPRAKPRSQPRRVASIRKLADQIFAEKCFGAKRAVKIHKELVEGRFKPSKLPRPYKQSARYLAADGWNIYTRGGYFHPGADVYDAAQRHPRAAWRSKYVWAVMAAIAAKLHIASCNHIGLDWWSRKKMR